MSTFLVELYATTPPEVRALAASGLTRTVFVPGDETCFFLFEAGSASDVERALDLAGVGYERVVPAVVSGGVQ